MDGTGPVRVRVELYAELKRYAPPAAGSPSDRLTCALTPPAGAATGRAEVTVADLLAHLGIPPETQLIAGINGVLSSRASAFHDGDDVVLLPPMQGGRSD